MSDSKGHLIDGLHVCVLVLRVFISIKSIRVPNVGLRHSVPDKKVTLVVVMRLWKSPSVRV